MDEFNLSFLSDFFKQHTLLFSSLAIAIATGTLLTWIFLKLLGIYGRTRKAEWALSVKRHTHKTLYLLVPILLCLGVFSILPGQEPAESGLFLILKIFLIMLIARLIIQSTSVLADVLQDHYNILHTDNLKQRKLLTQLQFVKRIITVFAIILAGAIILMQFEEARKFGSGLLTSAGVAGIIIGFAAQKSIANLIAGFQIAFSQPIRIDDAVVVEGEWGRIEEITLTYVVVRIWDKRRLVLPLNYFIESPFQNWTRTSADIVGVVYLYTDYQVPVASIRDRLDQFLSTHPLWDQEVKKVQVTDARPDTLEVRLLVGARNAGEAFDLRCDVREDMIRFLREHYPESLPRTRLEIQANGQPSPLKLDAGE